VELGESIPTFALTIMQGPALGTRFLLAGAEPGRVLLGQSDACVVRLTDPTVSRRHAALEITPRGLRLTDLQSRNGTRVNGLTVVEAVLEGGEQVSVGDTVLKVEQAGVKPGMPTLVLSGFGKLLGQSTPMRRLYPTLEKLARSDVAVTIEGETGTGKEVLAESLHEQGPRAGAPFVVFDCAAVATSLADSELFGHERGAFTGAVAARPGLFEQAEGGTLLIDEIGDLELSVQAKLLGVLERAEVRRVGGTRSIHVNVRVIAATRRDLDREVQAARFRDDLFHRLAGARVELPPLRERPGDVRFLARHFATQNGADPSRLPEALLARWEDGQWPGNVRELRNAVARFLSLGEVPERGAQAATEHVNDDFDALLERRLRYSQAKMRALQIFERLYVQRALADHDGDEVRAAAASGLARRHFQQLKSKAREP
jgi:DNA-binding NtrC family response regulator